MSNQISFGTITIDQYSVALVDGSYFYAGPADTKIPYDFTIRVYGTLNPKPQTSEQTVSFAFPTSPGVTSHKHKNDPIAFYVTIFFTNSEDAPQMPTIRFRGDRMRPFLEVSVSKATKYFENFVDILRNESPLYLNIMGEIDEANSHYHEPDSIELLDLEAIQVEAIGEIRIGSGNEKVGEGEDKKK